MTHTSSARHTQKAETVSLNGGGYVCESVAVSHGAFFKPSGIAVVVVQRMVKSKAGN